MKICIPTEDDRGLESTASRHFGSAPFFTMADTDSGGIEVVRNPDCHHGPQSCHHIPILRAHRVDGVVCNAIGRRAHSAMADAGIDILAAGDGTVSQILATVSQGDPRRLSIEETCGGGRRHGHGHRHGPCRGHRN
jgi:predicted Fe-Mo cluster-binding NifX family protein